MATNETNDGGAAGTGRRIASGTAAAEGRARVRGAPGPAAPNSATTGAARAPARRAERRPELVKQRRDERRQAYEKQRRQWLLTRIGLGIFGLLALAGVGYGIFSYVQDRQLAVRPEGTRDFQYAGGEHSTEPVTYSENPPVGGAHDATWQNCGFYDQPVRNENGVHSLEHGAVWITYDPELPQDQIDSLREKADQDYILVSPYEGLPTPVVASSWGHQVQVEGADDERLDQFIRMFKEGPDTPEPGAACFGGVGTPL